MPKRVVILVIAMILLVLVFLFQMNKQSDFNAYKVSMQTANGDLLLEDFKFISVGKKLYVDSYILEKSQEIENKVTAIEVEASINDQVIMVLSTSDLNDEKMYVEGQYLIDNLEISPDSILNLKFRYTVNGVKLEHYEELNILDYQLSINNVNKTLSGHKW